MATTTTPVITDNVSLIGDQVYARGTTPLYGTVLDLRTKFGAWAFVHMGRGGTAALSAGVDIRFTRSLNNLVGSFGHHPAGQPSLRSSTAATTYNSTVNVDAAIGAYELKTVNITSAAVGDVICIQDSGGGVTRLEFNIIAKLTVASGTGVTLEYPLTFAHTSVQADTVRNGSDVFAPVWLDGGSVWESIVDYESQSTGDSVTIGIMAQTYASLTNV